MTRIGEVVRFLESIAPPAYQESYDNSGLIVGDTNTTITGIVISLDSTEDVVNEAIALGANMIVAHHPIVFKGLKRFNGKNYVERTVMKAIKHDIAIYAIHTNLDSMLRNGVNTKIAEILGLRDCKILAPKQQTLSCLTTFVPTPQQHVVLAALYAAGAGQIGNYKNCSFSTNGMGSFLPTGDAKPNVGALNEQEEVEEGERSNKNEELFLLLS